LNSNPRISDKPDWLLVIRSNNKGTREYSIKPGKNSIGRKGDNDIVLVDTTSSGCHAEIFFDQAKDTVAIRDCESTNGTFVNGKRIYTPQTLYHEDQIRVGMCLITTIHSESNLLQRTNTAKLKSKVTKELILESVDQYAALLHNIGQQLVDVPDLDLALFEISELIKSTIGAEDVQVILADKFGKLDEMGIPVEQAENTIENKTANIFLHNTSDINVNTDQSTIPAPSLSPMLLVPVVIDDDVVALIFARKPLKSTTRFYNSDLQLVLAISNQVAMSIQRSRVESELLHQSHYDSLTDLPNRAFFLDRLSRSLARSRQEDGGEFAVLYFDIDNFKDVNESQGYAVGDKLLKAVASRLKNNVKNFEQIAKNSVIARFGGDEFAILLNDLNESVFVLVAANQLKETLSRPYNINGKKIFSSASIGVAISTLGFESPEDVLQDADLAMYQAKEMGKEQVAVFDKTMRDQALSRIRIGTALRQGILQEEFRVHYQPIISLKTGRIAGFEALLRWYTPDQGILKPDDFLHLLDITGLVYLMDKWVLQNACSQVVEWQNNFPNDPPLYIAVNLSAKNLTHPNLVGNVNQVLQETKLDPGNLYLEVRTNTSSPDNESTIEVLRNLRSLGVRIAIDDFGTGYSALSYLVQLPVDVMKIDQSYIKMIGVNEASEKIIKTAKALGSHLGIRVVAEGVENVEQMHFAKAINCEYAQGFHFSKPLDAKSATELLAEGLQF